MVAAIALLGLSLGNRPPPQAASGGAEAFDGHLAAEELSYLAARFPRSGPGSAGDGALTRYVAQDLSDLTAGGSGFRVRTERYQGQTVHGQRTLYNVVAERAGSAGGPPIVLIAHHDASGYAAQAQLSATALLLALAHELAQEQLIRPIVLVSSDGGTGGYSGAVRIAGALAAGTLPGAPPGGAPAPTGGGEGEPALSGSSAQSPGAPSPGAAAVISIGDVASARISRPVLLPYSTSAALAPPALSATLAAALYGQAGIRDPQPGFLAQLAHRALPVGIGEQSVFAADGLPAVRLSLSGEAEPPPRTPVSEARLEAAGSALSAALAGLEGAAGSVGAPSGDLEIGSKVVPEWAIRLLVAAALLPALALTIDACARVRGRRAITRALLTVAAGALPFLAAAILLLIAGAAGLAGTLAVLPATAGALTIDAAAALVFALSAIVLLFGLWRWLRLARSSGGLLEGRGAGLAVLILLDLAAVGAWIANPYLALLLLPAVHLWIAPCAFEVPRSWRPAALALVLLGLCAPVLTYAYYASGSALGGLGWVWLGPALFASRALGPGSAILFSVLAGAALCALARVLGGGTPERLPTPRSHPRARAKQLPEASALYDQRLSSGVRVTVRR